MDTFKDITELINTLYKYKGLLSEMFGKRKSVPVHYDSALASISDDEIQSLIKKSVITENGRFLEIDDVFTAFFEQVLEINENLNISYINENIENVKQNINYYLIETIDARKNDYLKKIKRILRTIGAITLKNVIDLGRHVDITYKNEPNYKIKKKRLEHLDKKRNDIKLLIDQTEKLLSDEEKLFFLTASDEEFNRITRQLKIQLNACAHDLIGVEQQIIEFLNQINYPSLLIEKLRQLKYLKDQHTIRESTDIVEVLARSQAVVFERKSDDRIKLSLRYLQSDEAVADILKAANQWKTPIKASPSLAEKISPEYFENQKEVTMLNLEEVKNGFLASGNNLFDFVMAYDFRKEILFDQRVTLYCQMVSRYSAFFEITDRFQEKESSEHIVEYAMVFPK